jgi:5-methylcytosine-specific restriction endonuclease McrA
MFRKERNSEDHPQYKRVEQVCGICGVKFHIAPGRIKRGIRFCSPKCGNESRARRLRKEESDKKNNILRDRIAKRDGNKCKICGFSAALEVHHITPKSEGGTHKQENLITLCPNHHAMVHKGLIQRSELTAFVVKKI